MPKGEHDYLVRVFDGAGAVVPESPYQFQVSGTATTNVWSSYQPKPAIDAPGMWTFKVSLGGEELLVKRIQVGALAEASGGGG